ELDPVVDATNLPVTIFQPEHGAQRWRLPQLMQALWGSGADPAALDGAGWNPLRHFAGAPMLAWTFVAVRFLGSGLVVPPLEEAFYRSLVYRSLAGTDFLAVSLRLFAWRPFALTALVFGFAHEQWLAGIVCGAAYQWLVLRHGRLGEAMTAHAVTNVLLGVWVVAAGDWRFW
ncbi:MAG: CAAX prenyl protease-related protein, partial [Gammaproteobacteria bacterium]